MFAPSGNFLNSISLPNSIPGAVAAILSDEYFFLAIHLEVNGAFYITLNLHYKGNPHGEIANPSYNYAFNLSTIKS